MTGREKEKEEIFGARYRAQAMTSYARSFFRSISYEDFVKAIGEADTAGQQVIVEKLYSHKVIDNVVKTILGKIDKGNFLGDQMNDYIQDAVVVIMKITREGRLDLTKTPGEIASYICLWIEQRVKRLARKDQRWRFSLYDTLGDIESCIDLIGDPELHKDTMQIDDSSSAVYREPGIQDEVRSGMPGPCGLSPNSSIGFDLMRKENDILSLFGSSITGER